jgi:cardiolipin synthase
LSLLVNLEANLLIQDPTFAHTLAEDLRLAFAASREVVDPDGLQGSAWAVLRRAMVAWVANVYLRVAGANERY